MSSALTGAGSEKDISDAGSSYRGEPVFLAVGKIRRSHGLRGEMLMDVMTHFPERLVPGKALYIGEGRLLVHIDHARWADKGMLIAFKGYDTAEAVAHWRNTYVYVKSDELPDLPSGVFYHHQLLGLRVVDQRTGRELGVLSEILETGANDVYVVTSAQGQETLLAAIEEVILQVDVPNSVMYVCAPDWL
ncbi:MAG: 16S rRNA processing protein RimM [Anaerolineae bacterium]|nr:16S rRNA processing protein RimM [Anaerolineae bacterium]